MRGSALRARGQTQREGANEARQAAHNIGMFHPTLANLALRVVMRIVPMSVKLAIVVGMGILVAMIGMVSVKLIVANQKTIVGLGDLTDFNLQLPLAGLILIGSLVHHNIKGGILIGIVVLTTICWSINDTYPTQILEWPAMTLSPNEMVDFGAIVDSTAIGVMLPAIAAFVFIGIFDVSGVMFGLSALANLSDDEGNIPGSLWAFLGSSVGTVVAAVMGCSPIIVTVECAAGIKEGGKTGLTAVTIGGKKESERTKEAARKHPRNIRSLTLPLAQCCSFYLFSPRRFSAACRAKPRRQCSCSSEP